MSEPPGIREGEGSRPPPEAPSRSEATLHSTEPPVCGWDPAAWLAASRVPRADGAGPAAHRRAIPITTCRRHFCPNSGRFLPLGFGVVHPSPVPDRDLVARVAGSTG